jgi:HAD superfamily hydrolase (TIGR01549 family)
MNYLCIFYFDMIQTVIFDMDGVIVDTEPLHQKAYREHFSELGITVSDAMYASFTGNSTKNVYQKIKENFNLPQEVSDLINQKRAIFKAIFDHTNDLYLLDGVEELMKDLYNNKVQLILASSSAKATIHQIFTKFNLHSYFAHIVSGEDFPLSKPNPEIFIKAVALSGNKANECVVIEDSTNGIRAANAAGIFCIGYKSLHSKLQDYSTANYVIEHFNELSFGVIKSWKLEV